VVLRDERDVVVATSASGDAMRPAPGVVLEPDTLLPPGVSGGVIRRRSAALPIEGGRVPLASGRRPLGWLDIWGTGAPAGAESRRALADVARLIAFCWRAADRARD
jgi:hypothetical protein